ncbi:hypothetical protein BGX27_008644 [Mortierella sp. AM989]|nr:hypothetical protein BGX27_008644 [Mortierella sp. AM989]
MNKDSKPKEGSPEAPIVIPSENQVTPQSSQPLVPTGPFNLSLNNAALTQLQDAAKQIFSLNIGSPNDTPVLSQVPTGSVYTSYSVISNLPGQNPTIVNVTTIQGSDTKDENPVLQDSKVYISPDASSSSSHVNLSDVHPEKPSEVLPKSEPDVGTSVQIKSDIYDETLPRTSEFDAGLVGLTSYDPLLPMDNVLDRPTTQGSPMWPNAQTTSVDGDKLFPSSIFEPLSSQELKQAGVSMSCSSTKPPASAYSPLPIFDIFQTGHESSPEPNKGRVFLPSVNMQQQHYQQQQQQQLHQHQQQQTHQYQHPQQHLHQHPQQHQRQQTPIESFVQYPSNQRSLNDQARKIYQDSDEIMSDIIKSNNDHQEASRTLHERFQKKAMAAQRQLRLHKFQLDQLRHK